MNWILIITVVILLWIFRGCIDYISWYYNSLLLEIIDRDDITLDAKDAYEDLKTELNQRKWIDFKFYALEYRWPFKCVRFTKEYWRRKLNELTIKVKALFTF